MSLELDSVIIDNRQQRMLGPISLTVAPGQIYSLMGPSGCGKSTLLSYLAGALPADFSGRGELRLDGEVINALPIERRQVGILFQDPLLFPHMTVLENLVFATPGKDSAAKHAEAELALEKAGLMDLARRYAHELSGGQRARISLLRTLQSRPRALLLDEPFSKLDSDTRSRFRRLVFDTVAERRIPAILVTHDELDIADPAHVLRLGNPQEDSDAR